MESEPCGIPSMIRIPALARGSSAVVGLPVVVLGPEEPVVVKRIYEIGNGAVH